MTLPNFLVIGAPKAGTTTLNYALDQHPQVYMAPVKESGFFWIAGQDIQLTGPGAEHLINRVVTSLPDYEALFAGVRGEKAIGESSVRYLASAHTPEQIHRLIPDVRLVAILRQPAERAFSAYSHNRRDGIEPCADFAEALAQDRSGRRDAWLSCRYMDRGLYHQSLERYLRCFDRSQMFIALFDDLRDRPAELMANLFRFLGVDDSFQPDLSHKHNASGVIRNPLLRLVWTRTNRLRAGLRPLLPPRLRHTASEWVIQDLEKLPFPPGLRAELTDYYRQDILQLQDLLQRDLSGWLKES